MHLKASTTWAAALDCRHSGTPLEDHIPLPKKRKKDYIPRAKTKISDFFNYSIRNPRQTLWPISIAVTVMWLLV